MVHPCPACKAPVEQRHPTGRPRLYCSGSCKSAEGRRLAKARTAAAAIEIERTTAVIARYAARTPFTRLQENQRMTRLTDELIADLRSVREELEVVLLDGDRPIMRLHKAEATPTGFVGWVA